MRTHAADHLEALSLDIERKQHKACKALTSNSLLQQLFGDMALKMDLCLRMANAVQGGGNVWTAERVSYMER